MNNNLGLKIVEMNMLPTLMSGTNKETIEKRCSGVLYEICKCRL